MSHPADAWMPFYGDEFLASERVLMLSRLAELLYVRLLLRQWKHGSIPTDSAGIRAVVHWDKDEVEAAWPEVEQFFPVCEDGKRRNARCTFERAQAEARVEGASERARKMNERRWSKHKESVGSPQGVPVDSTKNPRTGWDRMGSDGTGPDGKKKRTPPVPSEPPPQEGALSPQPFKPATSPAIMAWNNAWAMHREGEYTLLKQDAILLNKLGKDHGVEALAVKADSLLADSEPWVWKNASPRLLATRWNQTGQAAPPPKSVAVDRMREQIAAQKNEVPTLDFLQAAGRKRLTQ